MNRAHACLRLLIVVLAMNPAIAQQPILSVRQSVELTSTSDGFAGRLELLEDARLTDDLDKVLWCSGGPEMALDEKDPHYRQLTTVPLQNALLRLKDQHGNKIQEMELEREQARIRAESLHPGHHTFFVTTDLSSGFGSYSGPLTQLLDVSHGRLYVVNARDAKSAALEPIHLASTLKTAWKISSVNGGSTEQKDILEIACRPNADASVFYVTYTRYHWNGKEWINFTRRTRGFWETDDAFPSPDKFPTGIESHVR